MDSEIQNKLYCYVKAFIGYINIFDIPRFTSDGCAIDKYFSKLESKMDSLLGRCDRIEEKLDKDIKELTEELEFYKAMIHSVAETLPDMMWCKSVDGKYLYANKAIREGLIFSDYPIGRDDVELANRAKELFGPDNHTFGEKCANSDKIVLENMRPMRFLESGKIRGKMVYLEVFKAPMFIGGKLSGVVGTGRDMTEYVEVFREHNCGKCSKMVDIFEKYEFEG